MKSKQLHILKNQNKAYGGELQKTRKGRQGPRPLDTRNSMHLVLRSSKAKGLWSFNRAENYKKIKTILAKFTTKYGIQILSMATVGNHLHLHIKLTNRHTYKPFIRATTASIAMAVTKCSRWHKGRTEGLLKADGQTYRPIEGAANDESSTKRLKFWDYRPFTRVIVSFKNFLNLKDYIKINQLEGFYGREFAVQMIKGDKWIEKLLSG